MSDKKEQGNNKLTPQRANIPKSPRGGIHPPSSLAAELSAARQPRSGGHKPTPEQVVANLLTIGDIHGAKAKQQDIINNLRAQGLKKEADNKQQEFDALNAQHEKALAQNSSKRSPSSKL